MASHTRRLILKKLTEKGVTQTQSEQLEFKESGLLPPLLKLQALDAPFLRLDSASDA